MPTILISFLALVTFASATAVVLLVFAVMFSHSEALDEVFGREFRRARDAAKNSEFQYFARFYRPDEKSDLA